MNEKCTLKASALLALILSLLLLCACTPQAPEKVSPDVMHLSAVLEKAGYATQYYEEGNATLSALAEEMEGSIGKKLSGQITGYLFVQDTKTGASAMEVFTFQNAKDATLLYNHLKDQDTFVKGESECRIDCTVVYMGYISALEEIEGTVVS